MDPEIWTDPQNFRPERFLDENMKITGKENVIPFGLGKQSYREIKSTIIVYAVQYAYLYRPKVLPPFDCYFPIACSMCKICCISAVSLYTLRKSENEGVRQSLSISCYSPSIICNQVFYVSCVEACLFLAALLTIVACLQLNPDMQYNRPH